MHKPRFHGSQVDASTGSASSPFGLTVLQAHHGKVVLDTNAHVHSLSAYSSKPWEAFAYKTAKIPVF